ncbi:hypothetical protein JI744_05540 [Tabrizicola sp. KVB23]|uniref:Uncharacterized protein n=2 Tax=Fuscibacter oryzae TaxID=2803939 RepID=A0A8J7MRI9_9RHOB|nr:hypothetical protein [Fuscibacter oryzae]
MTLKFSVGEETPDAVLAVAEDWIRQAAEDIARTVQAVRAGGFAEVKTAEKHVRDLRAALELFIDERNRVEKLRKQVAGAVGASGLDFDAARDEIGRRLARLRDAGPGGELSGGLE